MLIICVKIVIKGSTINDFFCSKVTEFQSKTQYMSLK